MQGLSAPYERAALFRAGEAESDGGESCRDREVDGMPQWAIILLGILIPFAGTVLGAGMVFFLKKEMNPSVQKFLLGFAAGVMTAASVWSLLLPAFELSEGGSVPSYIPTAGGFLLGIGFLLLLDKLVPHQHLDHVQPEGLKAHLGKNTMLMLAVTIHNIPEGMVIGAAFAGMLNGNAVITLSSTLVLAAGIALQNFPEGTIISMPLRGNGFSKGKAFLFGALSGAVEPIAAAVTLFTVGMITPIFPYLLSFAAGAMIYVVVEELIPEAQGGEPHTNWGTIGVAIGFALMMVLDVVFG